MRWRPRGVAAASARRELEEGRSRARDAEATRRAAEALSAIEADREAAIEKGESLREQIDAIGPFFETEPVQEALDEFRRMAAEPRVPEARGRALIQSWLDIQHTLSELVAPPQPPEWLVAPAMTALQEAKAALAAARQVAAPADATKVSALEAAHREVLDAEQRVMRKGSRTNRRRLEHAQEAEKVALDDLGVTAYGDYLQRIAPGRDRGGRSEGERLRQAEAALTDAEAVWEELHGYQASPEWTAARSREAEIRVEIHEILGETAPDEDLVATLEMRLAVIIETELARDSLETSLRLARVRMVETDDVVRLAEEFLAAEPERQTRLDDSRDALAAIEAELASVEERRRAVQENAFFGNAETATPADLQQMERNVEAAVAAEAAATAEVETARGRVKAHEATQAKVTELDAPVEAARAAHAKVADAARAAVDELAAARANAAPAEPALPPVVIDTTPMSPMEIRLYLLARFTSLKARAGTEPRPVVVEARAPIGPSVLDLLNRTAGSLQLVVVTDDAGAASWASGLGEAARLVDA